MNVSIESLRPKHKDAAPSVFAEIAKLSGAGDPGPFYEGGIDITGALDPDNKGVSDAAKAWITQLVSKETKAETTKDGK